MTVLVKVTLTVYGSEVAVILIGRANVIVT